MTYEKKLSEHNQTISDKEKAREAAISESQDRMIVVHKPLVKSSLLLLGSMKQMGLIGRLNTFKFLF